MENFVIKNIDLLVDSDVNKTRLTVREKELEKEIILKGNGSLKIAVEA